MTVLKFLTKRNLQAAFFMLLFLVLAAWSAYTENIIFLFVPVILLLLHFGWQALRSVFFLLLFLLPLSIEYGISDSLSIDLPDEPLMIFLAFAMIATWIHNPRILEKAILGHPLITVLIVFLTWTLVTVIFSSELIISVKYFLAKTWYILVFVFFPLIYFQDQASIKKAGKIFLVALSIAVLIVLVRHALLGLSFSEINNAVMPLFRNHVNYSAMLVCGIPVLVAGFGLVNGRMRIFWIIGIAIFLLALYFSYSRGAWLALLAGIFSYWLIRKKLLVLTFLLAVATGLLVFSWLRTNDNYLKFAHNYNRTIFHKDFRQHIKATYELEDISTAERFYRWVAGVRMIKDGALTGFGPNSFYHHYKDYTLPAFETWVSRNTERSTIHNYFLLVAIEQGIPGLLLFLILIGLLLYYAQLLYHRNSNIFYRAIALTTGVILTMIIVLNFLSDLIETDKIGSIFFLSIALLVAVDIKTRKKSNSSPHIERIPQPITK